MTFDEDSQPKDLEMTAGDVVVTALLAENIDTIFGIIGSHVVGIYGALRRSPEIKPVSARHECSVTFMAAGYARVTGQVGVAIVTAGPGILNAMNGIGQANFSALPMVVIAGAPPNNARPFELHALQNESYSIEAVTPLVKWAGRPRTVHDIGHVLAQAFFMARSGRPGPVYVEIPWDLFTAQETSHLPYQPKDAASLHYDEDDVMRAYEALGQKKNKLIIIDKAILHDPDTEDLIELAEKIGAGICVTRDALGVVDETHPLYRGVVHDHMFGPYGYEAVETADVCLLFGFDMDSDNHHRVLSLAKGAVIMMSSRREARKPYSLRGVCERLREAPHISEKVFSDISHMNNKRSLISEIRANPKENIYLNILDALGTRMKPDDISLVDAGNNEVWARTILPVVSPLSCIGGANWASMGYALPTAIAARIAKPEKRVICITGDGCLLMSLMDLSTFFEAGGPSVLVVLNDSEYGMMSDVQISQFSADYEAKLPQVDFVDLAISMGGCGARITSLEDIIPAVEMALNSTKPVLLDVICRRPPLPKFLSDTGA